MKTTKTTTPKNLGTRELVNNFSQNTPLMTKGVWFEIENENGDKSTTLFLTANQDLAMDAEGLAEKIRVQQDMEEGRDGNVVYFGLYNQGLSEILDENGDVKEEFCHTVMIEKGKSLNTDKKFNYPCLCVSTDPKMANMYTQLVAEHHLAELETPNYSKPRSTVDYSTVALNVSIATPYSPATELSPFDTVGKVNKCKESIDAIISERTTPSDEMDR